ncbi:MAG: hypothetical protein K2H01_03285, partial [Ruminococcus sp.]|nr:hypothetical protein [Ruminococcus sp.]
CIAALVNNLKKLFIPVLIIAVFIASMVIGLNILFSNEVDSVQATISFYYNGIENGLDPNGCEFNKTDITNSDVINQALSDMGFSDELAESVENGIFVDSIVSTSAIDNISNYKSLYDSVEDGWTESLKDSSYHPTAYRVSFNYGKTHLSGKEAADLLNCILDEYQTYFFKTYGYNESVGNSVLAVDFDSYDYLIALDMYSSKLTSVESYINTLAKNDKSQFRSDVTGYSFTDLANSLNIIRSVDVDALTSYILNNGVISNKSMILSYYNYRMDNLKRQKQSYTERLNSIVKSINDYQKDSIIIYNGISENATTITETSDIYDSLIQNKIQLQNTISYYDSQISSFTDRINSINTTTASASDAKKNYVKSELKTLTEKTRLLIENIKITANDYYKTEKFPNAVSITVPAEHSIIQYIKSAINESIRLIIIFEFILFSIYLFIAIIFCAKSKINIFRKTSAAILNK